MLLSRSACWTSLAIGCCGFFLTANDATAQSPAETSYTIEVEEDGTRILRDGQLVAKYWPMYSAKPILWPLVGPRGDRLTRGYPMQPVGDHERADHVHHRSFWMTHGDVNGVDFWAEGNDCGKIKPLGDAAIRGGTTARLDARHAWQTPDGKTLLTDLWQLTFDDRDGVQWIDCVFTLTAGDEDVVFGDTKEGSFGIRVAGTMKVDAKKGGKILNAEGQTDKQAWGQPSPWVDYSGPVGGERQGVTIMNHPDSYGYPTRWHVRNYGLFAANPFGVHHFVGGGKTGGKTLPAGESLQLRYRVVLHDGDADAIDLEALWNAYQGD